MATDCGCSAPSSSSASSPHRNATSRPTHKSRKSKVIVVEDSGHFDTIIESSKDTIIVVDFFTTWCGPCKRIAPQLEELAREKSKVWFIKVDAEKFPDLASSHNVDAFPTFAFYKNKEWEEEEQFKGADIGQIRKRIERLEEADKVTESSDSDEDEEDEDSD